jgi:biopolymer transport protein ExbB/TolQ
MARDDHGLEWPGYVGTVSVLVLALLFPLGLMIFNPTLMFQRGWEQYVGTGIYISAVLMLFRQLVRLWQNERAFQDAPRLLKRLTSAMTPGSSRSGSLDRDDTSGDRRILPSRIRQLVAYLKERRGPSVTQLMEVNREGSGLDQEQMAGRFSVTRYILYLLPVIGFIGTVEGISKALMNISKVLPMVKNLDGFLTNLTSVTAALQIAFDSTLLALFLSAALMLAQTLVFRRSEELLARVDRWIVEHVLPQAGTDDPLADQLFAVIDRKLEQIGDKMALRLEPAVRSLQEQADRLGESLRVPIGRFAAEVERLPEALASFSVGAERIGRAGNDLQAIGLASETLKHGVAALARIESRIEQLPGTQARLVEIKQGLDRAGAAIENLAGSWSAAYERSSRATQEQLARSLTSLKDALELLNVSMEQGNSLYRNIVKKLFDDRTEPGPHRGESIRVA